MEQMFKVSDYEKLPFYCAYTPCRREYVMGKMKEKNQTTASQVRTSPMGSDAGEPMILKVSVPITTRSPSSIAAASVLRRSMRTVAIKARDAPNSTTASGRRRMTWTGTPGPMPPACQSAVSPRFGSANRVSSATRKASTDFPFFRKFHVI